MGFWSVQLDLCLACLMLCIPMEFRSSKSVMGICHMSDSKNPTKFLYIDFDLEFEGVLPRLGVDWRLPNMIARVGFMVQIIIVDIKCLLTLVARTPHYSSTTFPWLHTASYSPKHRDGSYFHMCYTINKHETAKTVSQWGCLVNASTAVGALQTYIAVTWDINTTRRPVIVHRGVGIGKAMGGDR